MSDIGIIKEDEYKISVCKYYLPCVRTETEGVRKVFRYDVSTKL